MKFYGACNCGKCEWMGSDPPRRCAQCKDCQTGPGGRDAEPHVIEPRFNASTGKPDGGRCRVCYERFKDWEHEF